MNAKPWTADEDAYLRDHYATEGSAAVAAALGRTIISITKRAPRLSCLRVRRWTENDDGRLQVLWGVHSIKAIAKTIGRTEQAVYWRARELDLGLGCPQGHEYLSAAAVRTGFAVCQIRRILAWAHVRIARASVRPGVVTKTDKVSWVVEPSDVDDAIARWMATETVETAAERRDISSSVLLRLLGEAMDRGDDRVPPKPKFRKHWRIATTLLDELVGAYQRQETLHGAAFRVGVTAQTLAGWLTAAGVTYSRLHGVDPDAVDRVIEEKRAAGCKAWRGRKAA